MAIDRHRDPDQLLRAGEWLRQARKGLHASELAELVDTSPQNISNYERGKAAVSDEMAAKIAIALGIDEITTRRGLGLWVPGDAPTDVPAQKTPTTLAAIQRDTTLIPEAREHLMKQYKLLRRISPTTESAVDASLDAIAKATHDAVVKPIRRRKPKSE